MADSGRLLELDRGWARNMVTGFARVEGRAVGVVANQPRRLGGVIDAEASEKAALFVERCDRFGIPLLVLVDTPGFMPGSRQEDAGVIRYGAQLLRAFAAARVPKLTVVLRKAYGGAVITMNSRGLGADMVFAWPQAEIGIMAARQAVGIVERRRIAAAPEPESLRDSLAGAYAGEHLTAAAAAAAGFVDEVIEPDETRRRVDWALGRAQRAGDELLRRPRRLVHGGHRLRARRGLGGPVGRGARAMARTSPTRTSPYTGPPAPTFAPRLGARYSSSRTWSPSSAAPTTCSTADSTPSPTRATSAPSSAA